MIVIVAMPMIMGMVMAMVMTVVMSMAMSMMMTVMMSMVMVVMAVAMMNAMIMRPMPIGSDPGNMMVMTDLRCTDVAFIADDLFTVLTQGTVHVVFTA